MNKVQAGQDKEFVFERTALLLHQVLGEDTDLSDAPYQSINLLAVRYLSAVIEVATYTQSPMIGCVLQDGLDMMTDLIYTQDRQEVAEKMTLFANRIRELKSACGSQKPIAIK